MIDKIYREKLVFSVVVNTRHFLADFFQWFKNLIGMRLSAYESMIEDAIEIALQKLYKNYPDVYDLRIATSQTSMGASEIIVYGKIKVLENE